MHGTIDHISLEDIGDGTKWLIRRVDEDDGGAEDDFLSMIWHGLLWLEKLELESTSISERSKASTQASSSNPRVDVDEEQVALDETKKEDDEEYKFDDDPYADETMLHLMMIMIFRD